MLHLRYRLILPFPPPTTPTPPPLIVISIYTVEKIIPNRTPEEGWWGLGGGWGGQAGYFLELVCTEEKRVKKGLQ